VYRDRAEGAGVLVVTLAIIGALLPIVYLGAFFNSVRQHISRHGLEKGKHVYTVNLSEQPDGIRVLNETEQAKYRWNLIYGAYRIKSCTCLYIIRDRAFLLPDDIIEGGPYKLWELLRIKLPPEKLHDARNIWI